MRLATAGDAIVVTADRLVYRTNGDAWDIEPSALHATVNLDRLHGDEAADALNAAHAIGIGRLVVHLHDATCA